MGKIQHKIQIKNILKIQIEQYKQYNHKTIKPQTPHILCSIYFILLLKRLPWWKLGFYLLVLKFKLCSFAFI